MHRYRAGSSLANSTSSAKVLTSLVVAFALSVVDTRSPRRCRFLAKFTEAQGAYTWKKERKPSGPDTEQCIQAQCGCETIKLASEMAHECLRGAKVEPHRPNQLGKFPRTV